jgi:hypothetical protein
VYFLPALLSSGPLLQFRLSPIPAFLSSTLHVFLLCLISTLKIPGTSLDRLPGRFPRETTGMVVCTTTTLHPVRARLAVYPRIRNPESIAHASPILTFYDIQTHRGHLHEDQQPIDGTNTHETTPAPDRDTSAEIVMTFDDDPHALHRDDQGVGTGTVIARDTNHAVEAGATAGAGVRGATDRITDRKVERL